MECECMCRHEDIGAEHHCIFEVSYVVFDIGAINWLELKDYNAHIKYCGACYKEVVGEPHIGSLFVFARVAE